MQMNIPFYRYCCHIELTRFKMCHGMPRWREHDPICSLSIYARFSGQFFFKFSFKEIVMGKKAPYAVFGCNNDRLFPKNIQWSSLFARKARVNTERVPPGHPIILLKSIKFNVAPLSVKRSITKFENTENSCPKLKLYFKKSFKRIKVLNPMETCPKAKFGSSSRRLPTFSRGSDLNLQLTLLSGEKVNMSIAP